MIENNTPDLEACIYEKLKNEVGSLCITKLKNFKIVYFILNFTVSK
jgi:hypothetical protein